MARGPSCWPGSGRYSADVKGQTRQVLSNIDRLLASAGSNKSNILSATVYLSDIGTFAAMNAEWDAGLRLIINPPAQPLKLNSQRQNIEWRLRLLQPWTRQAPRTAGVAWRGLSGRAGSGRPNNTTLKMMLQVPQASSTRSSVQSRPNRSCSSEIGTARAINPAMAIACCGRVPVAPRVGDACAEPP